MTRREADRKIPQAREQSLRSLAASLSYEFEDLRYLDVAMTHASYANEHKGDGLIHNQRLEFLGDAVLDLIIGEYLFLHRPDADEGNLTKYKAAIVSEVSLAPAAGALQLGEYLLLGRGEAESGGRMRRSILADTFEAVVGALYLDGSYESTRDFVLRALGERIADVSSGSAGKDCKTVLQEEIQARGETHIRYKLLGESGPDHDKTFEMEVYIGGRPSGRGTGHSKKEAEQQAAGEALRRLQY